MYLVLEGEVVLSRQTNAGTCLNLQVATPVQVLAEASAYSRTYHCDARTNVESAVMSLAVVDFHRALARDPSASDAWTANLAQAVQSARLRAEIRTLKTVSERLDAWLGQERLLPGKGKWSELAAEIGVSREALYRELARRRAAR